MSFTPGLGERFNVTSFSSVTSVMIAENDYLPSRFPLGGVNIAFVANSNWLATIGVDNGVGIIDITSLLTGAASVGGVAGGKFFRIQQFFPWKVWLNVTSCPGNVNVSVSL